MKCIRKEERGKREWGEGKHVQDGGEQNILFRGLKTKELRELSMEPDSSSLKGRLVQKILEAVSALLNSKAASSAAYFFVATIYVYIHR